MNVLFVPFPRFTDRRAHLVRSAAVAAASAVAVVAPAAAASAHVHVIPDATNSGATVQLTFRVPNESATADFDKLLVTLPKDKPIPAVATKPVPGWAATIAQGALPKPVHLDGATLTRAPRTITWTAAAGHGISQHQYQEFPITAGPLPAPGRLAFPTAQYYSDGTVVRWNQPTLPGTADPQHPVPTFTVTASNGTDDPAPMVTLTTASTRPAATGSASTGAPDGASDGAARGLAGAALAVAVAALAASLRRRSTGQATPNPTAH